MPESTESILIDMLPLLQRLGYRPDITDSSQYKKIDLNPRNGSEKYIQSGRREFNIVSRMAAYGMI